MFFIYGYFSIVFLHHDENTSAFSDILYHKRILSADCAEKQPVGTGSKNYFLDSVI